MNKYISEFIGTFLLVFTGTGAIIINDVFHGVIGQVGIALSFGLAVMVAIYMVGSISGAHINPAVSFAFFLKKELTLKECTGYVFTQLLGAFCASGLLKLTFENHPTLGATIASISPLLTIAYECLLTFLLMMTILKVSESKNKDLIAPIAVGGIVALEALVAGPITGASMNPARSISPAVLSGKTILLWIYIVVK